ncbi:unnamed protein product [Mytilus edulis]|uniref:Uncharacterized protein n=1 Tax=Mytilus edulis TaxID=6550 RepID=A0A8S3UFK2_MYTED|nr:unnamed protein product [Mytilus edulis]
MEHSQTISEGPHSNNGQFSDISYAGTVCNKNDKSKLPDNCNDPQHSLNMHNGAGGTETQRIQTNTINQNPNNFRWNVSNTNGDIIQTNLYGVNHSLNNTTDNIARTVAYQIPNNYSTNDTNSLIRISQTSLETLNRNVETLNHQISGQITTTDRTSNAPMEQLMMGICVDNPKYPKYAIRISRLDSFKHWPTYLTQSPDEMATAGFFFTGGLKNWEPGDEHWVEHASWYQKCAFCEAVKGDRFIEDVQTNKYIPAVIVEKNMLLSTEKPLGDFNTIPAVISVTEFGYDEKLVKEAYGTLQKQGQSGMYH